MCCSDEVLVSFFKIQYIVSIYFLDFFSFGGVASYAGKYPCSFINTAIGSSWVLSLISKKGPLWFGVAVKLGQIVFSLVYCGFHVYERLSILLSTSAPSCVFSRYSYLTLKITPRKWILTCFSNKKTVFYGIPTMWTVIFAYIPSNFTKSRFLSIFQDYRLLELPNFGYFWIFTVLLFYHVPFLKILRLKTNFNNSQESERLNFNC